MPRAGLIPVPANVTNQPASLWNLDKIIPLSHRIFTPSLRNEETFLIPGDASFQQYIDLFPEDWGIFQINKEEFMNQELKSELDQLQDLIDEIELTKSIDTDLVQ